jgi:hypothetical protein
MNPPRTAKQFFLNPCPFLVLGFWFEVFRSGFWFEVSGSSLFGNAATKNPKTANQDHERKPENQKLKTKN